MLVKSILAPQFNFIFLLTFVHHKFTKSRASLFPDVHSVKPLYLSPGLLSVPLRGPEKSCFLPVLLPCPGPGMASLVHLSSSGSSPPEASLMAPAHDTEPSSSFSAPTGLSPQ